jgi:hypothetical protein
VAASAASFAVTSIQNIRTTRLVRAIAIAINLHIAISICPGEAKQPGESWREVTNSDKNSV